MLQITDTISLDETEIEESFIRASGPGGQNVNKVATAVQLRFDVRNSPSLPEDIKRRLSRLAGRRMTQDGVLVLTARRHRSQERNRAQALASLIELIRRAETPPRPRRPTRPTHASRLRHREAKSERSKTKRLRRPVRDSDRDSE